MSPVQPRASNAPLPLLCALGRHKTDLLVRWNDGYYFTRCRRCGLDLVRTAFSGWTAPKRYRVVWQAEPPVAIDEQRPALAVAETQPETFQPSATDAAGEPPALDDAVRGQVEFPIRDLGGAPPPGLSMTEEAFAARPDEDATEDPFHAVARNDRTAMGRTAPLQGRKDGIGFLPIEDVFQSLRTEPATQDSSPPSLVEDEVAGSAPAGVDVAEPELAEPELAESGVADDPADAYGHGDEPVQDAPPPTLPEPPESPPARARYPVIPDFMDEEFPGITWDPSTGKMIPGANRNANEAARDAKPGWRDAIRERAHAATTTGLDFLRARTSSEELHREPEAPPLYPAVPPRSFLERQGGLVAATIFGGFVLAAAIVDARSDGPARFAYRPELRSTVAQDVPGSDVRASDRRTASAAGRPSAGDRQAFVTASLLNCRAVPTNDGETVRRLSRGDAVQVLGADPGWVSVSHQGRQCWASSEWISTVKPL